MEMIYDCELREKEKSGCYHLIMAKETTSVPKNYLRVFDDPQSEKGKTELRGS
jgi:hypothetical protein